MTVAELRAFLADFNDDAEVLYFDSEMGKDRPLISNYISVEREGKDERIYKN